MDYFKMAQSAYRTGKIAGETSALKSEKDYLIRTYGQAAYDDMLKAVKNGCPAEKAVDFYRKQKAAIEVREAPPVMGSAKWANWHQLMQAKVLHDADKRPSSPDIYFGAFLNPDPKLRAKEDNWLYWHGNSHLMTIAPTGSGKSAVQIIPNLLSYQGSVFVFDPKGELYNATSFYRSQIGKVYRLAPFEENSNSFNPLDGIKSMDDAIELAQVIFPPESQGDGAFYENEARGFLAALLYLVSFQQDSTMGEVRRLTALPGADFRTMVNKIADREELPTPIRRAADLVRGFEAKTISTLQRSLFEKMQIWDSEAIQRVTEKSDFSFAELKHSTTTVYITVPFHRIEAYSHYVKAMMTLALEAMVATPGRPKIPVLFMLDEFLALGSFHRFVSALRTHRDAGVRLWFFLQSVADLEAAYPEHWKAFFTATEVKSFFGVRDHYTGEIVANLLGNQTLAYTTTSTSSSMSAGTSGGSSFFDGGEKSGSMSFGSSTSTQVTSRQLLTPNEVQQFLGNSDQDGTRFGILNLPGMNPVQAIHLPWYKGYTFWCRFGSRDNVGNKSRILPWLWHAFNHDFFDGQLKEPSSIEYQDFSMGRDGYAPFNAGIRAFHDSEHDRIVFMAVCRQVEEAHIQVAEAEAEPSQKLADLTFAFLGRVLLHEMIHQAAYQLGGAARDDHGAVFAKYANEVYERSRAIEGGFEFIPPSEANLSNWPMMVELDTVLKAIADSRAVA